MQFVYYYYLIDWLRCIGSSLVTKLEKENINVKVDIIHGVGDLQRRSQVIIVKTWILLINPTLDIPNSRDGYNTDEECLENGREYCNGEFDCLIIAWNDADLNKNGNV